MDQQAQEQLTRALSMMNDAAASGGNFVLEQAPMVARELVAYTLWSSAATALLSGAALVVLYRRGIPAWKKSAEKDRYYDDGTGALFFLAVGFVVSGILFLGNSRATIKAVTAPRLVILDYVKDMVKK